MTETADILIIGGGIAGISAGARLAGEAKVIVLEREDTIGTHSTGRSAAIFVLNYGNAVLRALNAASAPIFHDPGDLADGPLLTPRGHLDLATAEESPLLEQHLAESDGLQRLSPAEAVEIVPILRREKIVAAAYEPDASDIDVDRLLQGYARQLRNAGGQIIPKAEVQALTRIGGNWRAETSAGKFEAPVVINAAGAWADQIAQMAGISSVGLQPMRRSAVIVPAPEGAEAWPLFGSASETWYAKPQSGKLMISPADEDLITPQDAWPDDMVLAEGIHRFEQMTTLQVTRVERSWAGLRSFVPDRTPVVGFAPGAEGFFWLAGQGGYGIQTSPALSQLCADLILGRTPGLATTIVDGLSPARDALTS